MLSVVRVPASAYVGVYCVLCMHVHKHVCVHVCAVCHECPFQYLKPAQCRRLNGGWVGHPRASLQRALARAPPGGNLVSAAVLSVCRVLLMKLISRHVSGSGPYARMGGQVPRRVF